MNSHIMDSRMLNVFHEDPFEGNFIKYDPEPNFWSTNDDLQLTDTLNGILPIEPTGESLLSQCEAEMQLQNSKNLLIYSDFVDQQLSDDAHVLNDQQRQLSALIDSDEGEDEAVAVIRLKSDDDVHSQCSNSTFRTRTDSSSIGDYESHSSDYDDEIDHCLLSTDELAMQDERKNRTLSTNTYGSDADALGLNIDVNNFDLADFITKDDFATNAAAASIPIKLQTALVNLKTQPTITAKRAVAALPKAVIISSKSRDSDYDSDSIIDVETVDVTDVDESRLVARQTVENSTAVDDLCYVDNVKDDPSWCPKQQAKRLVAAEHKIATATNTMASKATVAPAVPSHVANTAKPKATNNICLVPNKKQCDFLKRKVGAKAAVNQSSPIKSKVSAKKIHEATKSTTAKQQQALTKPALLPATKAAGLGLGGKNLALLKHERDVAVQPAAATFAPKRKLNLEEYKQRRCGTILPVGTTISPTPVPPKQAKVEPSKVLGTTPGQKAHSSAQKAAISTIVNSLKSPVVQATVPTDPITAAKNKVLRMLEMKRAQQLKIIDSRVTAKVPRVTKLPPLKDIVKDTYYMTETELQPETAPTQIAANSKLLSDYEEIIIVSTSCNTDITIPPLQASVALRDNRTTTPSSRSLLKSSVLLYNISNGSEAGKDMTNSLIASIQCEVVKQTNCVALATATTSTGVKPSDKNAQHGEDMVIMHLAKNRVRKHMVSMGTQTDLQPEFPLLTLPTTRQSRERTRRAYRKRRHDGNASNESSCSSSSTCSSIASYRSRSRSNSNSMEHLRNSDATAACGSSIGGGGYSSRSTRRHRSSVSSSSYSEAGKYERQQRQRRTSYNKRRSKNQTRDTCSTSGSEYSDRERSRSPQQRSRSRSTSATRFGNNNKCNSNNNNRRGFVDRNVSQPAVEERRIVYVGRIEPDTNKEQLRRKFLPYGSIKQITIHYKENGMKYGFVTFERAQDAFTAIDTSARDAQINMYDISFGGRRAFCRASYADLDNAGINNYHSYVFPKAVPVQAPQEDSFEALLLKVKAKLNAGKPAASVQTATAADTEAATPTPTAVANLEGDNKINNMSSSQI